MLIYNFYNEFSTVLIGQNDNFVHSNNFRYICFMNKNAFFTLNNSTVNEMFIILIILTTWKDLYHLCLCRLLSFVLVNVTSKENHQGEFSLL